MANIRESAELYQRLVADDDGYGGDGRRLPRGHNGPPVVNRMSVLGVAVVAVGVSGLIYLNIEEIKKYLNREDFTPEDFLDAIGDAIRDALS